MESINNIGLNDVNDIIFFECINLYLFISFIFPIENINSLLNLYDNLHISVYNISRFKTFNSGNKKYLSGILSLFNISTTVTSI